MHRDTHDNELKSIVEALTSWLHFESACGHKAAFEEKYLLPALTHLLAKDYGDKVLTSVQHPVLDSKEKIDFAVIDRTDIDEKWELAVETKWLPKQVPHSEEFLKRIVQDIVRLEMIGRRKNCKCWLLVGGKTTAFSQIWHDGKKRYQELFQIFLPSVQRVVGLNPGWRLKGQSEPKDWKPMREFLAKAVREKSIDCELGKSFKLFPEMPFSRASLDDDGKFKYRLPPHVYAVYGWRFESAKSTIRPSELLQCLEESSK